MARKRMLSPEMFTSASVAALPVATRWTWVGILTYLDDYGYGEDSASLIKAVVWPRDDGYTARKVESDITRIAEQGTLCRFVCCDKPQLHSPRWSDWQKVDHPARPRHCPCPVHAAPAHEIHAKDSRETRERLALIEVKSIEKNLSDESADLTPTGSADHAAETCPDTRFCRWHRNTA